MTDTSYNEQLARTRAADKAHEKMMQWYAAEFQISRAHVARELANLSESRAKQLLQKYQEQL